MEQLIHVGLVVNDQDPENRNRLQIFIPHLTNTVFKGWNDELKDISFKTFETGPFSSTLKNKLMEVLPWAEAAVPTFGGGTSGRINTSTGKTVTSGNLDEATDGNPTATTTSSSYTPQNIDTSTESKGNRRPSNPRYIILHDSSAGKGETPTLNSALGHYNYVVDGGKAFLSIKDGLNAPHAMDYNSISVGIARVGMEGQPMSQQDIQAMASIVSAMSQKYNIPASHILTHYEAEKLTSVTGLVATDPKNGGKDSREGNWKNQVLAQSNIYDGTQTAAAPTKADSLFQPVDQTPVKTSDDTTALFQNKNADPNAINGEASQSNVNINTIDKNMLKYLAGIGHYESGFDPTEAYSNKYNSKKNPNVAQYGSRGADYGYYQVNQLQVDEALKYGIKNLNTGTLEQQTVAMSQYIQKRYPDQYQQILAGNFKAADSIPVNSRGETITTVWKGLMKDPNATYRNSADTDQFLATIKAVDTNPSSAQAQANMISSGNTQEQADAPDGESTPVQLTSGGTRSLPSSVTGTSGFVSAPAIGAKVWVFFHGGDIQRPVYFASVVEGNTIAALTQPQNDIAPTG